MKLIKKGKEYPEYPALIAVLRDEFIRIPYFLKYYNKIGIKHFIFIDNNSKDGSFEYLQKSEFNITLYHTTDSYRENKQGNQWREDIMKKYGENKWYLLVDMDELFMYYNYENKEIKTICDYCNKNNWNVYRSFCLDMYPNKKLCDMNYKTCESFFKECKYFDKIGKFYDIKYNLYFNNKADIQSIKFYYDNISGGVRKRCLNYSSELTEHILIKYDNRMIIYPGTHQIGPRKLIRKSLDRGVLLHFKWISINKEYIDKRLSENQMYDNSKDYKKYKELEMWNMNFYDKEYSEEFISSEELKKLNIII